MTDQKEIMAIFNDFIALYKGEKPIGLRTLYEKYQTHPMLIGLISNLDEAVKLPIPKVMHEVYDIYKKYRDRKMEDADWEAVIEETRELAKARKDNKWCNRMIIEIINLLAADDKERRAAAKETAQEMEAAQKKGSGREAA